MEKIKSFIHQYWFIILVTLVAAVLRLYRLESSLMFLGDQGRDAIVLKRILIDHDLPFIGPITSVGGFYLGPLYYYLMTPFLWLFKYNPVGPAIATAIIGVITTPVLYFVAKKMFSTTTARWASFLFAIGFIPVSETRSAWNPNPMPLASLGLIYGLYLVNQKKKPELIPGKVTVTAFLNGWCPAQSLAFERAKRAASELGDKVVFQPIDTFNRNIFLEWGITDALLIDGKQVRTGPPPSYEKIRKLIARRVKKL